MSGASSKLGSKLAMAIIVLIVAVVSVGIAALMLNIFERKIEAKTLTSGLLKLRKRTPTLKNGKSIGLNSTTRTRRLALQHVPVSADTGAAKLFLRRR